MLAKCVLASPATGHRLHWREILKLVRSCIDKWLAGDLVASSRSSNPSHHIRRAKQAVQDGQYTKAINPFTGNVALLHHARPLERAMSHYCTTGSRGLFTAYFDLLVLRFSIHCSSAASLYILFHHHVYIFTYVSVAVRKTCLFVPSTCCDASTCSRTTQKQLHTSSKAI